MGSDSDEVAVNGQVRGDGRLFEKELAVAKQLTSPGYYPSVNGAEIADAQRSGLFPCATFTGNFEGPNQVFAWRSQDSYQAASFVNNRRPGELFITGGGQTLLTPG